MLWGAEGAYVWSIVDGKAQRTPVKVVQRREGRVLIDGELGANGMVVVEGTQRMRNGIDVKFDERRLANPMAGTGGSDGYAESN